MAPELETKVGKLRLRNPTLLAGGILGLTGSSLKRVWESGAGAVVSKSVSKKPSEGYSGPRVVEVREGLLNAIGLSNPGVRGILGELEVAKNAGATVVGSVFGKTGADFADVAREMEEVDIDAVELNLSCPHAGGLRAMGQNPELVTKVIGAVKEEVKVPVWAKLPGTTNVPNLVEVARAAEAAGADALTISNTVPAIVFDIDAERPVLGHKIGGLSGPAIKPISMRLVYEASQEVNIPVVGSGGVVTAHDAVEYFMAGASAVQIGTGIMYRGLDIFKEVCDGIQSFMEQKDYKRVGDLVGLAHSA